MKNILFIVLVIACIGLIAFGVINKNSIPGANQANIVTEENNASTSAGANVSSTANNVAVSPVTSQPIIRQEMTKYYPDNTPISGASGAADADATSDQNFQITTRILAQMHLINKYKPGICFGTPSAPPQVAIDGLISSNQQLAKFIKQQYNLSTDLEVYNKLKQLQGISLTETQSGKFDFVFMDGQCSDVVYYEGVVEVVSSIVNDTVTSRVPHSYQ